MKQTQTTTDSWPKLVKWNWNNLPSIKKAERQKAKLENAGYSKRHEFVNSITGECSLAYYKN